MTQITGYRRPTAGTQPDYLFPRYASTVKRAPTQPLVMLPQTETELTGPVFGYGEVKRGDHDLTRQHAGEPIGERIIVSGRVLDENGRPLTVSGCPPDYFAADGQRWNNPHYDWDLMASDGFAWWRSRIARQRELFDLEADPYERNDLAHDSSHAALMDELLQGCLAWWKETGGGELDLP